MTFNCAVSSPGAVQLRNKCGIHMNGEFTGILKNLLASYIETSWYLSQQSEKYKNLSGV
jgi:hypothetical protein